MYLTNPYPSIVTNLLAHINGPRMIPLSENPHHIFVQASKTSIYIARIHA